MESQKRQVEPFAFDDPNVAVEDHRTVLTFAAEVQVEEEAPIFSDDEVSKPNVAQVFISDIMDLCRQADLGGSVHSFVANHDHLSMSSYAKPRVEAGRASIDSSSTPSSKDKVITGESESIPHHLRERVFLGGNDANNVGRVSRHTTSTSSNGNSVGMHDDSDLLHTEDPIVMNAEVKKRGMTAGNSVKKKVKFVDLAGTDLDVLSPREHFLLDEEDQPLPDPVSSDGWLQSRKKQGSKHQRRMRVGASRQTAVPLGGELLRGVGHTSSSSLSGATESQKGVNGNRFIMLAQHDEEEVADASMEIDTAIEVVTKRSASESSTSSISDLVPKPAKSRRRLLKQRQSKKDKRLAQRKRIQSNEFNSKLIEDPQFIGFSELNPEGEGIVDVLNRDNPTMVKCFQSLIEEIIPDITPSEDAQVLYVVDDPVAVKAFASFTKELHEQVGSGKEIWLVLDTGANQHVIKDLAIMKNRRSTLAKVVGVSGGLLGLDCEGEVVLDLVDTNGGCHKFELSGAYGLVKCPFNLVSVSKLLDDEYWLSLNGKTGEHFLELPHSSIRIPIVRKDGLLLLKPSQTSSSVEVGGAKQLDPSVFLSGVIGVEPLEVKKTVGNFSYSKVDHGMVAPMNTWHERVRHLPMDVLHQIHNFNISNVQREHDHSSLEASVVVEQGNAVVEELINDRQVGKNEPMMHGFFKPHDDTSMKHKNCDVCRQAKMRKKPQKHQSLFQQSDLKQGRVFSCDLKSVAIKSFHGHCQVINFVEHTDDGSPGIVFHYLMKSKSESTAKLLQFINDCKKLGIKIARIQTDRGTEFFEQEGVGAVYDERAHHAFRAACNRNNIDHTVTPVGDKEKYAERWNKEHFKTIDVYLWNARLAPQFWSYALDYSVYQYNRTPVKVGDVWFKSPHHYYTGEVPRWDKWRVFGCDAFNLIANNKLAKYPGIPTGKRSIFVGFDKDGGSLLFDMEKRRHFHSNHTYFNESFESRHNALQYFDQRRHLALKGLTQPLQINDFEDARSDQVRNLYISPSSLIKASQASSSNVGIGGDSVTPGTLDANGTAPTGTVVAENEEQVSDFEASLIKEKDIIDQEKTDFTVRPLRLESEGTKQDLSPEHREFLSRAELFNYPIKMKIPCPKKGITKSSIRYKKYMLAETIKEMKALGADSGDVNWDYQHGYMTFPGRESKRSGHVFNVFTYDPDQLSDETVTGGIQRNELMNQVLIDVEKDIADKAEYAGIMQMLNDKLLMVKFADSCGESLRAMVAGVKPTLDQFVDWHIAAEPTHYNQTLSHCCSEHEEWQLAMEEEIASMKLFEVFDEVDRRTIPKDRQVLDCKWVYKRKRDKDGKIVRYRARVVAMGFRQRAYDSFIPEETHSPVVSKDTLRLFLSICAKSNLTIYQADVKAAFLQAPLKEEIYMKAPPGFRGDDGGDNVIWKLKSAVYGLKQASACFWTAVHSHLVEIGFHSLTGDPCLFQKNLGDGKKMLVCCYVDDITYAVESKEIGDAFLMDMRKRFFIGEDEGKPIEWLLGMAIKQDVSSGTVSMNMTSMIDKLANLILTKEELAKAQSVSTPMLVTPLMKLAEREVSVEQFDYLSVVGSLLHIANCVRCDIAFAVGCLARYAATPGHAHVKAAKRVVKYLYATKNLGITFYRDLDRVEGLGEQELTVYENGLHPNDQDKSVTNALKIYADSDYAMDYTKKSTMGIVFMLNGGPVSWTSVLGKTVATSTCEAEVNAAVSATKDAMHFKLMLQELGMTSEQCPIKVMEDNSACIAQAESGIHHVRNAKHYEVKLRFLQESVVNKAIEFEYCPTDKQLADFFTKPLDEEKFLGFRSKLMCEVNI